MLDWIKNLTSRNTPEEAPELSPDADLIEGRRMCSKCFGYFPPDGPERVCGNCEGQGR